MDLNPNRARQRRYERSNREKENERRRRWRLLNKSPSHGKTRAEIHAILERQGFQCAICAATRHHGAGWHGDHDHKTGAFRGVLCRGCNVGLGNFKDKVKLLRAAILYLERHEHEQAQLQSLL
jgi:hypothetical protein